MTTLSTIAIFCGAHMGNNPNYAHFSKQLINELYQRNIKLIYGGAKVGIMGIIADEMLRLGGEVIGIIPQSLVDVEIANKNVTTLHIVKNMYERKNLISELADGFIMLPGGTGSLDEFFEVLVTSQLGYHKKPCGILNCENYFDNLLNFFEHSIQEGFTKSAYRDSIISSNCPKDLLNKFFEYTPLTHIRWVSKEESS